MSIFCLLKEFGGHAYRKWKDKKEELVNRMIEFDIARKLEIFGWQDYLKIIRILIRIHVHKVN